MLNNKEKIYDEKEIIAHFSTDNGIIMPDHKVTGSAEKPAPILIPAAAPITCCSPRRPHRGDTLGGTVSGAPTGGGVLRWELARAPIQYTTY